MGVTGATRVRLPEKSSQYQPVVDDNRALQNPCLREGRSPLARDTRIMDFYSGLSPDHRGRHLNEILEWSDDELERVHDYIQWLFPLTERSGFNSTLRSLTRLQFRNFDHDLIFGKI
jgi:hypothetical protein